MDSSSGASLSVREMLRQLVCCGYEVEVIGATVFDAESGMSILPKNWKRRLEKTDILELEDAPLLHKLLMTSSHKRDAMTALEEAKWYEFYLHTLDIFMPDLVWFYGGRPFDFLISDEARHRGISVAAYLVNGNYTKTRWCRDVDLIVTDSKATAEYYFSKNGLVLTPVGKFIDQSAVVAEEHFRRNVLFVNPSLEKGAVIVVQIAMQLERQRPDIQFEVVESRGNWSALLQYVSKCSGHQRDRLENVLVTRHTREMRAVYSRARLLLAPCLWWESGSRVLAEAMLNAIPAIVTDRGGNAEMIGAGGITIALPAIYHEKPYTRLLEPQLLDLFVERIIEFYDNESRYNEYVVLAREAGEALHNTGDSTRKLFEAFNSLISEDM